MSDTPQKTTVEETMPAPDLPIPQSEDLSQKKKKFPGNPLEYLGSPHCEKARERLRKYEKMVPGLRLDDNEENIILLEWAIDTMSRSKEGVQKAFPIVMGVVSTLIGMLTIIFSPDAADLGIVVYLSIFMMMFGMLIASVGIVEILQTDKESSRMANYQACIKVLKSHQAP